jgi:putative nucleotidyltransferase with HDIG domain
VSTSPPALSRDIQSRIDAGRDAELSGAWDVALAAYDEAAALLSEGSHPRLAADLVRWTGTVHRQRGDFEMAERSYRASQAMAAASGLTDRLVAALNCLAAVDQLRGELDLAESRYLEAQRLALEIGDDRQAGMIDQNLGTIANIRGDFEVAQERYRSALASHERTGDERAAAGVLMNLGITHVDLEEWRLAENFLDRAFLLAEGLQDSGMLGDVQLNRAELYLRSQEFERARECCDRAFEIFGRLGDARAKGEVHKYYGVLYRETGKPILADTNFTAAVRFARESRDPLLEAETLSEWALVHLGEERNRDALDALNQAHALFSRLHANRDLLDLDRRLDRLEGTYLRVVRAWAESIESKDRYTAGHCERVANYATLLAEAVGFAGRDLTWLRMGGFLHDVGKIAVPVEVLNKPGKLTAEEWLQMQSHTVEGDRIVEELNFPWDIRPIVRSHHERWDGSGYPDGLSGEEIPLTARILCVADIYDALTTTRSYRPALSANEALRIMEGDVGRILDPELFPVFRALIDASRQAITREPLLAPQPVVA